MRCAEYMVGWEGGVEKVVEKVAPYLNSNIINQ